MVARSKHGYWAALWLVCLAACGGEAVASGAGRRSQRNAAPSASGLLGVQILALNDFHGQLISRPSPTGRAMGGAAAIATHFADRTRAFDGATFIVHAGDHVGASPPVSAWLQDEPAITFFNLLGNHHCSAEQPDNPRCNLIGTLGNHEFDEGPKELMRVLGGGIHPAGPFLDPHYAGAAFPYVCANVLRDTNGTTLVPGHVVREAAGVAVGFVGAVLRGTPTIVTAGATAGLRFVDESSAINAEVAKLRQRGVRAIVVLLHQGAAGQAAYTGATRHESASQAPEIADLVGRLDPEVDVVVSGHAHTFSNGWLPNRTGAPVLVTQAWAAGEGYAAIELGLSRDDGQVRRRSAQIIRVWSDEVEPAPQVAELVKQAQQRVAGRANQQVTVSEAALRREPNAAGESVLGNLVADAQRAAMQTDFAFMNPGGVRADLPAGLITFGGLFAVQPFGNRLVAMELTGLQIKQLLEQQWQGDSVPRILHPAGLRYEWDPRAPVGGRIRVVTTAEGSPLAPERVYTVTVNSYLASGAENFTVLAAGQARRDGPSDVSALRVWLETNPQAVAEAALSGRVRLAGTR